MKKLFVIVSALIVAAACATPPPTNREATSNANVASAPSPAAMTETDAIAIEKAIWDTIKNKDYEAFAAMLAPEQLEVMPQGVMDKAGSITAVKQFEPSEVNFSDWKYLSVDNDAFIVVYTVAVKGKFAGKEFPLETAHASSAWVHRAGKWLAIYHQECGAKPSMPMPSGKSAPAKATASPVAPGAPPATGPDPIANEKIVWDLFKAKNYDAFAELLAPNFIEVESDGVYDRAAAIKGVSMVDGSKAVLSDFQAVNIDSDAALVVYTVKSTGPGFSAGGDRHSTIWVKREGKWMGLFHHGGTAVEKPAPTAMASPTAKASPSPKMTTTPAAKVTPAAKTP